MRRKKSVIMLFSIWVKSDYYWCENIWSRFFFFNISNGMGPPCLNLVWAQWTQKNITKPMTLFFASLLHLWIHFIKAFTPMGLFLALAVEVKEPVICRSALLDVLRLGFPEAQGCSSCTPSGSEREPHLFLWMSSSLWRQETKATVRSPSITESFISLNLDIPWENLPHRVVLRMMWKQSLKLHIQLISHYYQGWRDHTNNYQIYSVLPKGCGWSGFGS